MTKSFICNITSWYHMIGVLSYLRKADLSDADKVYIFVGEYVKRQDISVQCFSSLPCQVALYRVGLDFNEYEDVLEEGDVAVLLSPVRVNLKVFASARKIFKKVVYVEVEEGIGSYANFLWRLRLMLRFNNFFDFSVLVFVIKEFISFVVTAFIDKEKWVVFDKRTLLVDEVVKEAYIDSLSNLSLGRFLECDLHSDSVLIVSAPVVEVGAVSEEKYRKNLMEIYDRFRGRSVFINPHPIENLIKYEGLGFVILGSEFPVEAIFSAYKESGLNLEVVTFGSTATYTSSVFYGFKTYMRILYSDEAFCSGQLGILSAYSESV